MTGEAVYCTGEHWWKEGQARCLFNLLTTGLSRSWLLVQGHMFPIANVYDAQVETL